MEDGIQIFSVTWSISEIIQAVSALLSFLTVIVISMTLSVTRRQLKQSVRPVLVPIRQPFSIFYSYNKSPYLTAFPYHIESLDTNDKGSLVLSLPIENIGVGPATSASAKWMDFDKKQLDDATKDLSGNNEFSLKTDKIGIHITVNNSYRATYTTFNTSHELGYLAPKEHAHVLEQIRFRIPPQAMIITLSYFKNLLSDIKSNRLAQPGFLVIINYEDISSRSMQNTYEIRPSMYYMQRDGEGEDIYCGFFDIRPASTWSLFCMKFKKSLKVLNTAVLL